MKADFVSLKWPWQAMIPFKNLHTCLQLQMFFYSKKKPTILFLMSDFIKNTTSIARQTSHFSDKSCKFIKRQKKPQEDCT